MEAKKIGPKFYADANKNKPPEYSNYEELEITWGKQEDYEIIKKIGRGKYSEVYEGININNDKRVVIKVLKPVKKKENKKRNKNSPKFKGWSKRSKVNRCSKRSILKKSLHYHRVDR